jgi:RNA 2',3'-cyclic 3'-phosphodiesterase
LLSGGGAALASAEMSRGATARLFVALDPPLEVCEELSSWARAAAVGWSSRTVRRPDRAVRVLPAESLHLTLCFLGGRPVGEIEALSSVLSSCAAAVGELSVGAPVWLPPRRPRALAVKIHDREDELVGLHHEVVQALARASAWEPDRSKSGPRHFRAHVTVARMRDGVAGALGTAGAPLPATPQLRFTPEAIVLYRSWLAPAGAIYEAVASGDLRCGGGARAAVVQSRLSPSEGPAHTSVEPSLETTGFEPPSHSGSEPSSQT